MSSEALETSVGRRAADDYTGLWEVIRTVARAYPAENEDSLQSRVISLISELHEEGMIALGRLREDGGFEPWDTSVSEVRRRISREWSELGRRPNIGEIVWLSATQKGEASIK